MAGMAPTLGKAIDLAPRPFPERVAHEGTSLTLEPLSPAHCAELWAAAEGADASWTYMRYGPFASQESLCETITELASRDNQPFWAVRPKVSGRAQGWLSLCDVYREDAAIEIGSIWFSPELQRTRAATEAVFLLMRHVFDDLGYRRLVWRCPAQNAASCRAAQRYGFVLEGVWRDAMIVKGWQRDIAWFSMLADEWPDNRALLSQWLDEKNFDRAGRARTSLSTLRRQFGDGSAERKGRTNEDPREPEERSIADIRAAAPEDLERLLPLVAAFFREEGIATPPEAQRSNLLAMMAAPEALILLAQAGEEAVGFASATLTRGIEFGLAAEIEDLYVVPEARGQGLARRLMSALIDWCESQGVQEIIVVMTPEGMEATDLPGFYRRFGFSDSDRVLMYRSKS